jgi:orotate phosphoribosyltransferase
MTTLKVNDFVSNIKNKSSFDIDDLIHIAKRTNNKKRDYLFVNKYLGKHIPEKAVTIKKLFTEFAEEISIQIPREEKILVVGFAETATALAQFVTYYSALTEDINVVYHLQTTRESFELEDSLINIAFEEEHSHASSQKLLFKQNHLPDFDRILFIEDEITTGNTILNFIKEFEKIKPNSKYSVASILNWQNEENSKIFRDMNIQTISLINGTLRENVPVINVAEDNFKDLFSLNNKDFKPWKFNLNTPRTGMTRDELKFYIDSRLVNLLMQFTNKEKIPATIIGNEEDMLVPLLYASLLNLKFRATTRSPITSSNQEDYIIKDKIKFNGAIESTRENYIYNLKSDDSDLNIIVTDFPPLEDFIKDFQEYSKNLNKKIKFLTTISGVLNEIS